VSNQWVRFDLGKVYTLNQMKIWNCNDWIVRGVKSAVIQTAGALEGPYTTVSGITGWDVNGNLARTPVENDPDIDNHANILYFPEGIRARYVRILINSNWESDTGGFVGLVEVAFWQGLPQHGTLFYIQ